MLRCNFFGHALLIASFAQPLWHIARAKLLTNAAQHHSYSRSARYGRTGIGTHDPASHICGLSLSCILAIRVRTTQDTSDRPAVIVSKVSADAQIECNNSYKP